MAHVTESSWKLSSWMCSLLWCALEQGRLMKAQVCCLAPAVSQPCACGLASEPWQNFSEVSTPSRFSIKRHYTEYFCENVCHVIARSPLVDRMLGFAPWQKFSKVSAPLKGWVDRTGLGCKTVLTNVLLSCC